MAAACSSSIGAGCLATVSVLKRRGGGEWLGGLWDSASRTLSCFTCGAHGCRREVDMYPRVEILYTAFSGPDGSIAWRNFLSGQAHFRLILFDFFCFFSFFVYFRFSISFFTLIYISFFNWSFLRVLFKFKVCSIFDF
jgi:hypothetical protein